MNGRREMGGGLGLQAVLLAPHAEFGMDSRQVAVALEPGRVGGLGRPPAL